MLAERVGRLVAGLGRPRATSHNRDGVNRIEPRRPAWPAQIARADEIRLLHIAGPRRPRPGVRLPPAMAPRPVGSNVMPTEHAFDRAEARHSPSLELEHLLDLARAHAAKSRTARAVLLQLASHRQDFENHLLRGRRSALAGTPASIRQSSGSFGREPSNPFRQPGLAAGHPLTDLAEPYAFLVPLERKRTHLQLVGMSWHPFLLSVGGSEARSTYSRELSDVLKAAYLTMY